MRHLSVWILILVFTVFPAFAQEAQPGDACALAGSTVNSGGPEITDGYFLVCDGANWVSLIEYKDAGQILTQIGYDSGVCTAAKDGRLRYNSSSSVAFEYCDGGATSWESIKQPQCADNDSTACYLDPTRSTSDPEFVAANISSGKNIFGVTGSLVVSGGYEKKWSEISKETASDTADNDSFGQSVAVDGDIFVAGSSGAATGGAAYVFERDSNGNWSQIQILTASDAASGDLFGYSVSVGGDVIVIGARSEDGAGTGRGAAYVFHRANTGTWPQVQKLTASDTADSDIFGVSVAVEGDSIVVGADLEDGAGTNRGAAYVFERASNGTWSEKQKLVASDAANSDLFGADVAVDGDVVVVGAYGVGSEEGAAYIFERANTGTWSEKQILTASDAASDDWFGLGLSVDGDMAVIGAPASFGNGGGTAYVFERASNGTWSEVQILTASDAAEDDGFGGSVAVYGDVVAIGADSEDGAGTNRGATYVFDRASDGTWSEAQKLIASDTADSDKFGNFVGMDGNTIVAGAELEDGAGTTRGAAYVFYRDLLSSKPAPFDYTDQTNVLTSTLTTSNILRIIVADATSVSISGDGSPQYRICSNSDCSTVAHTWASSAGSIDNGEYLQLRLTSSASNSTMNSATVTVGTGSDQWDVTTFSGVTKAFFVITNSTWTGNLGGISGADSKCLTELQGNTFKDKANATLDASHVFAFICDSSSCNNLEASKTYYFAVAGNAAVGGDSFTTDGSGTGPGDDTDDWSDSTRFNSTADYWNGHSENSDTNWGTSAEDTDTANLCGNWSGTGDNGFSGNTANTGAARWMNGTLACTNSLNLVCFVNE